jgi:TolB-like protein/DNA-binding winged helix-turn-helix (wHTH) protein
LVSTPGGLPDSIRFGDDFELNVRAFELRSAGVPLKLKPIPMELLLFLIERRGELVTREQIVERIWGKGVFLDSDNSINSAISKIRQVLRDNPGAPRCIQTVTGRGYRFIAALGATSSPAVAEVATLVVPVAEEAVESGTLRVPSVPPSHWRWPLVLAIVLVMLGALGFYIQRGRSHSRAQASGRLMLAVLPFENLTGDAGQDYFSDGLTEEMIAQLGRIDSEHLGLIGRTSVMHYKHSPEPLDKIGRELGVQYLLEGSVRRESGRVRITAQLIQVKDQTHLWAQEYDRELKDLLVLQAEIAREISGEIEVALGGNKPSPLPTQDRLSPQNYEAFDLYLKGQYFWNRRTVEGFQRAVEYFQQAIAKDPTYARAYASLADSYALLGGYSAAPPEQFMPKARAAALQALKLDDTLAEAHTAFALIVQNYDHDWQTSDKEFRRAIELNPNYPTAHHWYAEHLAWLGRFDEALAESQRAQELDPFSLIIACDNGAILYNSRQYDRAIEQFRAVQEMDPSFWRSSLIVHAYEQKGMFAEALAVLAKMLPSLSDEPYTVAELAYIYGRTGQQAQARLWMAKLEALNWRQPLDPATFIRPSIGMGNKEQAFVWLEKAYAQHSNAMARLKVDPLYDPLRGDPRFQDLLRRVGLAQ